MAGHRHGAHEARQLVSARGEPPTQRPVRQPYVGVGPALQLLELLQDPRDALPLLHVDQAGVALDCAR